MVQNNRNTQLGGAPPLDDSWWTAVLEEVEAQFSSPPSRQKPGLKAGPVSRAKATAKSEPEKSPAAETSQVNIDWALAKKLYEQDQVIDLDVTGYNRGGLLVEGEQIQGFVPISHLIGNFKNKPGDDRDERLEAYVGSQMRLKVIECNPERGRVVLSERAAQTDPGRRNELLETLHKGDCTIGRVTTITDFGAFVDLGGVEGLVHISELSWGRVCHPADVVNIGEQIEVCVLSIDYERARVALSLKRMQSNPWETIAERYEPGQLAEAVITSVVNFGAFARLEDGLDGLIHISELRKHNASVQVEDLLAEGQEVQVYILNIDQRRQRLGLSLHEDYQ